jgi:hypothetical protein
MQDHLQKEAYERAFSQIQTHQISPLALVANAPIMSIDILPVLVIRLFRTVPFVSRTVQNTWLLLIVSSLPPPDLFEPLCNGSVMHIITFLSILFRMS